MERKQRVINFFAGPGAGKTAMMLGTAAKLKFMEMNVEIAPEYAKVGEWEGRTGKIRSDQGYIAAKQNFRQHILAGEVQIIVSDGPILLGHIYGKLNPSTPPEFYPYLDALFNRFDNLNFFVQRSTEEGKRYMQKGRSQNRPEAEQKDNEVHQMLIDKGITFHYVKWGEEHIHKVIQKMDELGWIKPWWQEEEERAKTEGGYDAVI